MENPDIDINGIPATQPRTARGTDVESAFHPSKPGHPSDNPLRDLEAVGLLELFDSDERPVLIYDLESPTKATPIYHNARARELHNAGLEFADKDLESFAQPLYAGEYLDFTKWVIARPVDGKKPAATYCGIQWTSQTLRSRWRVISGEVGAQPVDTLKSQRQERPKFDRSKTNVAPQSRLISHAGMPPASVEAQLAAFTLHREDSISLFPTGQEMKLRTTPVNVPPSLGSYDILMGNPLVETSAHVEFFQDFDWASTELGPIESWSNELRRMSNLLLADPRPAAMYWGENRIMMYNEPYVLVTGQKHPFMMGKPFLVAWAEVAGDFASAFEKGHETGIATTMDNALFYLERHGCLEETYYSISMIPFGTSEGHMAFYNPIFDTTRQVIADRRMAFLLRLYQYIASSREPKDFWEQLLRGLAPQHPDIPFAVLYSAGGELNEELSVSSGQSQNLRIWALEGSVRIAGSTSNIPSRLSSENDLDEFFPNFLDLIKKDSPTTLHAKDGSLPSSIIQAIQTPDNLEVCDTAVFLPIRPTGENALGFLIVGINARKRYDEDYQLFIWLLSRQLATSIAAAVLFEDETRRARIAAQLATQDRNLLSRKLAIQTHEALEIESRFRRMADMAPVGMFHINPAGYLVYANELWYDLTQHRRDFSYPMSWYSAIIESDHALMDSEWEKLIRGESVTFELRLNKLFEAEEVQGGQKVTGPTWIIAAAYPEKAEDGTVVGILGCLTDISRQKWAEGFQNRKMLEAVELKRQQENFIDITSHEMRNPLSAIIQCADMVCTSLIEFDAGQKDLTIPREIVDSNVDAAQTIILCAQHQTRIIDDILTLSKLDSNLLLITPIEVQPVSVIERALKMFDGELQKADVELRLRVEQSYTDLTVDWVKLDPSRMLQIFINLITNAIKFTQPEPTRQIVISVGASLVPPVRNGMEYLPRGIARKDLTIGADWGSGQEVYIYIEVQDSGRGLTDHERKLLFQRFSQASPRTHVQYGGSGLGLFISRELTELQGGQIGVVSKSGVGSTFAFYVRARRCSRPENHRSVAAHLIDLGSQTKMINSAALARIPDSSKPPNFERQASLPALPPTHVLIVEDNIVNQKILSKQLRNAGCIVSVANHGREALTFLSSTRFWKGRETDGLQLSLVLMDLEMPIMDGLTCVKKIRELQEEGVLVAHVPVIAVTANARSEQIATAKHSGMDSVVTKPFRIPDLMPEIERQLKRGSEMTEDLEKAASAPP